MDGFDPADLAFGSPLEAGAWRLPTREGLTWRLAVLDDLPRLHELWDEMDRTMRRFDPEAPRQDRPDLFSLPVTLTLVAVDDITGSIVSAIYGEAVVDWTMIGTSRRMARTIDALHPYLAMYLFARRIRVTRILVPLRLEKWMAKLMPQMRDITHSFAQFVCNLRN